MNDNDSKKQVRNYDKKYVRMGDWVEEFSRTKNIIAIFRNLRKRRKLKIQSGVSDLFNQLLEPVVLRGSAGLLKYGDLVQFMSNGLVLSIMVKDEDYAKHHSIPSGAFLTASEETAPCVRNSFLITNPWNKVKFGQPVSYGDNFAITTADQFGVPRLYAGADYPFGTLTLKPGHSLLKLFSYPGNESRFRIDKAIDPKLSEDLPVRPDEPFHILSSATHRNLVVNKNCQVLSILGVEKEVSFYYTPDWFTKYDEDNLTNLWKVNSTNKT